MRSFLILAALSALPQCQSDETVRAYGAGDKTWTLVELDGTPFDARATLTFPVVRRGPYRRHAPRLPGPRSRDGVSECFRRGDHLGCIGRHADSVG